MGWWRVAEAGLDMQKQGPKAEPGATGNREAEAHGRGRGKPGRALDRAPSRGLEIRLPALAPVSLGKTTEATCGPWLSICAGNYPFPASLLAPVAGACGAGLGGGVFRMALRLHCQTLGEGKEELQAPATFLHLGAAQKAMEKWGISLGY